MSYAKYFFIERVLRNSNIELNSNPSYLLILIAYLARKQNVTLNLTIEEIIKEITFKNFTPEYFSNVLDKKLSLEEYESIPEDEMISYLTIPNSNMFSYSIHQPKGINELCCKILELNEKDSVLDIGSGLASFLIYVEQSYTVKSIEGIDISTEAILRAKGIAEINNITLSLYVEDIFTIDTTKKYDKVFSLPPFKMASNECMQKYICEKFGLDFEKASSELCFMMKALDLLSKEGKAVICMPASIMYSNTKINKEFNKYLIENNYLEAVIELPGNIFPNTGVKTALIVLSHSNKDVRFVNASEMYTKERRGENVLLSDNVKNIYESFVSDSKFSKTISTIDISKKDFSLSPNNYLLSPKIILKKISDYKQLQELVEMKILRGVQIKADDLNDLDTTNETGYYYLSLKNIRNGTIDENLTNIENIEEKYNKYVLKENDMVLSLTATDAVKIAIATNIKNKKILVASNLYIIRLKNMINPFFLKALFETEEAQNLFASFTVGTSLPTISIDFLNKLEIPVPPLSVQNKIASRYLSMSEEKNSLLSRYEKLTSVQKQLFDNL